MVSIIDLREDITRGQIVAQYHVEGADNDGQWQTIARGTTIGYRKLDRVTPVPVRGLRVMIDDALETPRPLQISLY